MIFALPTFSTPCQVLHHAKEGPLVSIRLPVGNAPGGNLPVDVRTIQTALNEIPPEDGGPVPQLVVDGFVGTFTIGAIDQFQLKQLGSRTAGSIRGKTRSYVSMS